MEALSSGELVTFRADEIIFKSGAKFIGTIENCQKEGYGVFVWPNGAKYEGSYKNNQRCGHGKQIWHDKSQYEGNFLDDKRHGHGIHRWLNMEAYDGDFYRDYCHGSGTYKWPDESTYKGHFYMDQKEGYGVTRFANGCIFQGLYEGDTPFGPGFLTYPNKRDDVGLWHEAKLIKLCTEIEDSFRLKASTQYVSAAFINEDNARQFPNNKIYQSVTSLLFDNDIFNFQFEQKLNNPSPLFADNVDRRALSVNRVEFDRKFFENIPSIIQSDTDSQLWNKTPILLHMQQHYCRHKNSAKHAALNFLNIIENKREKFYPPGDLEIKSHCLLESSARGELVVVEDCLSSGHIHPDVADKNGNTALIMATVNWHMDIIVCLLGYAADINKLNDEGCSALSAGFAIYYPPSSFLVNIAETYIPSDESITTDCNVHVDDHSVTESIEPRSTKGEKQLTDQTSDAAHQREAMGDDESSHPRETSDVNQVENQDIVAGLEFAHLLQPVKLDEHQPSSVEQIQMKTNTNVNAIESATDQCNSADWINTDNTVTIAILNSDDNVNENNDLPYRDEDFDSARCVRNYRINVTKHLIETCATTLSANTKVLSGTDIGSHEDLAHQLVIERARRQKMRDTLILLLKRGADANISLIPIPVIFLAVKTGDVDMLKLLLLKKASPNVRSPNKQGGLTPLHIAVAIRGDAGIQMTELLLSALADPNARACLDDSYLILDPDVDWMQDEIPEETKALLGGRTPLSIACNRDDDYKEAHRCAKLLLEHNANTSLLCNGHSPLTLAIASGNELIIDELLASGADPAQPLSHGVGNALCVIFHTRQDKRYSPDRRLRIIDKLIDNGADILARIPVGPKRTLGTALDYMHYVNSLDRRIAHIPYHALTKEERETYNARKQLQAHAAGILRTKALERLKQIEEGDLDRETLNDSKRSPMFKFCHECGKSVGVKLISCQRCKRVYYCSKNCKSKSWNARHKDECCRDPRTNLKTYSHYTRRRKSTQDQISDGHPSTRDVSLKGQWSYKSKFGSPVSGCYRNPVCRQNHLLTQIADNLEGRCIKTSLDIYVDNYSFI